MALTRPNPPPPPMPSGTVPDPTIAATRTAWLSGDRDAWKAYSMALRRRLLVPAAIGTPQASGGPARPVSRRRYRATGRYRMAQGA